MLLYPLQGDFGAATVLAVLANVVVVAELFKNGPNPVLVVEVCDGEVLSEVSIATVWLFAAEVLLVPTATVPFGIVDTEKLELRVLIVWLVVLRVLEL